MSVGGTIEEHRAKEVITEAGLEGPPVGFEPILERYGIELKLWSFSYISGVLIRDPDYTVLAIKADDPATRRRFTIAHELGHFFLGHKGRRFAEPSKENPDQERAANRFAGALLMPADWLRKTWYDYRDNPKHRPGIVSEMFQVSPHALTVRLKELGIAEPPRDTVY